MITVGAELLVQTFAALRGCGEGQRECVAFWTGPIDQLGVVDELVQPPHKAGRGYYEVDSEWITGFYLDLRATKRTVRVQIHTHPGANVGHSNIDDTYPIAAEPGFVSLVVPHYATGDATLAGAGAVTMNGAGRWERIAPADIMTGAHDPSTSL